MEVSQCSMEVSVSSLNPYCLLWNIEQLPYKFMEYIPSSMEDLFHIHVHFHMEQLTRAPGVLYFLCLVPSDSEM